METALGAPVPLDAKAADRNDIYPEYPPMETEGETCFDIPEDESVPAPKGEKLSLASSVRLYWGTINTTCVA